MAGEIDLVRRAFEATNRRDIEALEALITPDFVFHSTFAASEGRTFAGADAAREYFEAVEAAFDEVRIDLVEVVGEVGGSVAVEARVTGRGRGSGITVDHVYGQVWTVIDGRVGSIRSYLDPAEAARAVGIER